MTVNFKDISLTSPDNQVVSRKWDFNSYGVTDSDEANPSYTYHGRGGKSVTLIVSTASLTDTLTIRNYIYISGKFAVLRTDTHPKLFGSIEANVDRVDDTLFVYNDRDGSDSISIRFDYDEITSDSGLNATPESFEVAPRDSRMVIFRIIPPNIQPRDKTVRPKLIVEPKFGFGTRVYGKLYQFRIKSITGLEAVNEIQLQFGLNQNYPNPFNPTQK